MFKGKKLKGVAAVSLPTAPFFSTGAVQIALSHASICISSRLHFMVPIPLRIGR